MRRHSGLGAAGLLFFGFTLILLVVVLATSMGGRNAKTDQPSGIWTGLVDDLPSGRAVECVMIRDAGGSVGITCDWSTATIPRR